MTTETSARTATHPREGLIRVALLIVAIVKLVGAFSALAILFDGDPDIPGLTAGGQLISATIILAAPLAAAALLFAICSNLTGAIVCIALISLLDWLSLLPSVSISWDEFPGPGFMGAFAIVHVIVLPALAVFAIVLAVRRERIGLATVFATLPTIVSALGVIAFAIGVAIYGF